MRKRWLVVVPWMVMASAVAAQQVVPVQGPQDLRLRNQSLHDAATVTLRYEVEGHTPASPPPLRLEPGQEILIPDVVERYFGMTGDAGGEIIAAGPEVIGMEWRNRGPVGVAAESWLPAIERIARFPFAEQPAAGVRKGRGARIPQPLTLVRVGDTTSFSGSHGVSGVATIVGKNVIRISSLRHDGSAPGLDLRVGLSSMSRSKFVVLQVTGRQIFNDATLDLTLPDSVNLNSFDTLTVWCYEFTSIIAEGRFRRP